MTAVLIGSKVVDKWKSTVVQMSYKLSLSMPNRTISALVGSRWLHFLVMMLSPLRIPMHWQLMLLVHQEVDELNIWKNAHIFHATILGGQ